MKRRMFISIVTVVLLCAGHLSAIENMAQKTAPEDQGPKIEMKEMRHDFGKVVEGTKVSHVFELKNTGSGQLIIQKVKPS